jgi:hypothetical protein
VEQGIEISEKEKKSMANRWNYQYVYNTYILKVYSVEGLFTQVWQNFSVLSLILFLLHIVASQKTHLILKNTKTTEVFVTNQHC